MHNFDQVVIQSQPNRLDTVTVIEKQLIIVFCSSRAEGWDYDEE